MKIGITLNDVLRDFTGQLVYTYSKYIEEMELKDLNMEEFDLEKYFKFEKENGLNDFLYTEASLEIFGHADQLHDKLFIKLNKFILDIEDEEEHEIILISKEFGKSIPSTLFFLSKLSSSFRNIKFVTKVEEKWEHVDLLITANPEALRLKPEGKISIKVNANYNKNVESDYQIDTIMDFIESEEMQNKILN